MHGAGRKHQVFWQFRAKEGKGLGGKVVPMFFAISVRTLVALPLQHGRRSRQCSTILGSPEESGTEPRRWARPPAPLEQAGCLKPDSIFDMIQISNTLIYLDGFYRR